MKPAHLLIGTLAAAIGAFLLTPRNASARSSKALPALRAGDDVILIGTPDGERRLAAMLAHTGEAAFAKGSTVLSISGVVSSVGQNGSVAIRVLGYEYRTPSGDVVPGVIRTPLEGFVVSTPSEQVQLVVRSGQVLYNV